MVWAVEEIEKYRQRYIPRVYSLYARAGIADINPGARAKYLAEKVLNITAIDHDLIMDIAAKEGKAKALHKLEDIFLKIHEGKDDFLLSILEDGGEFETYLPHFSYLSCYHNAKYNFSGPILEIEGEFAYGLQPSRKVKVPCKVEVLTEQNRWQLHPSIFTFEPERKATPEMVIFLASGSFYRIRQIDRTLLKNAERLGLTKGSQAYIKAFPREEE